MDPIVEQAAAQARERLAKPPVDEAAAKAEADRKAAADAEAAKTAAEAKAAADKAAADAAAAAGKKDGATDGAGNPGEDGKPKGDLTKALKLEREASKKLKDEVARLTQEVETLRTKTPDPLKAEDELQADELIDGQAKKVTEKVQKLVDVKLNEERAKVAAETFRREMAREISQYAIFDDADEALANDARASLRATIAALPKDQITIENIGKIAEAVARRFDTYKVKLAQPAPKTKEETPPPTPGSAGAAHVPPKPASTLRDASDKAREMLRGLTSKT